jgi:hypothetical protein
MRGFCTILKTRPSSLSMLVVWVVSVWCAEKLWECPVLLLCDPHVHDTCIFFKEEGEREREFLLVNVEHFTYECENFHLLTVITSWYVAFCSTKITLALLQTIFYYSVVNSLVSIVN